jgi:GH15 family glucan-1,4-alpha-glucosidase
MPVDKQEKTVDIDTSGPGADIEIAEEKVTPVEQEETNAKTDSKDDNQSADTLEKSDVKSDVQDSEQKTEEKVEEKIKEKKETSDEKQDEHEQYSESVQKRIAKLTKKWREAERQKEAAIDYARGVQTEHTILKTRVNNLEPSYVDAMRNKVSSGLEAAQAKLAAAREAGDIKTEVEVQKEIARLGVEEARVSSLKRSFEREARAKAVPTPTLDQAIQTPPADPKAEAWADRNEWFGKDSAMTYTAFDLHKKLTEEEGFDPNSEEYYVEIDKRMKLDFPHKFGKTETKEPIKPTQTVASATRSVKPGRTTVRLTSSQVAIAKKLGVPLEEYAKQLKITKEA